MVRRRLGQEPDVLFPENRHVRSSGLSGAPSLAHQPPRAKYTDISLSMTPGRDPGPQTPTVASASLFAEEGALQGHGKPQWQRLEQVTAQEIPSDLEL